MPVYVPNLVEGLTVQVALLQQHDFQVRADHAYICGCGKEDDPCDHPELGNIFGYL